MVTKEQVWTGLRLELSEEELNKIYQAGNYESDYYYDFDLLMNVLHKTINKEIDFVYFIKWCILVANCYNHIKVPHGTNLSNLFHEIGFFFDGISFMDGYDKKVLMHNLAVLKHYNYLILKTKKKIKGPFATDGVERLLCFDHSNWNYDSVVYRVIIKDYNTKEWELRYIDDYNFVYDENINYSFINDKEFNNIFSEFYNDDTDWKEIHNMKF